jgi:hypothetical protein
MAQKACSMRSPKVWRNRQLTVVLSSLMSASARGFEAYISTAYDNVNKHYLCLK